jgi:hypothetical protein
MMAQVQQVLLTAHRECVSAICEALTAKDIGQGVNNSVNAPPRPAVAPVVNDNVNEGSNTIQKSPEPEDEFADMNDVHQQNNLANELIQQQDVSLGNNKGHEVNMTSLENSHAADATMENMEGQDEETIVQGMAQPIHVVADNNNGQYQVNTAQGTPVPDDAPQPPLQTPCKRPFFNIPMMVLLIHTNNLQLANLCPLLQLQMMSL